MLTLPIKQEWFDMICRGEKREEYREATEYYQTRINSAIAADPNCKGQAYKIFPVKIRAGYNSKAPTAVLRVHCIFGKGGVREWGASPYCADFTDGDDGCCYWQKKEPIAPADTEENDDATD